MVTTIQTRTPSPVDVHVGARIRMRRKILNMNQEQLAATIKLTFQQVQKYERGANRVSASKLYDMARALQVPVSFFFEGLADPAPSDQPDPGAARHRAIAAFINTPEGMELAEAFPKIRAAQIRRQIVDLARAMADTAQDA